MLLWLFFLFTAVPAFELWLLFQIADAIGGIETIYVIILTGVLGSAMAKRQGAVTLQKIQKAMAEGRSPGLEMTEGLLILLGGVLLVTPGALTDVFGLLTLIPPTRKIMAIVLQIQLKKRMHFQGQVGGFNAHFGTGAGFPPGQGPGPHVDHRRFADPESPANWPPTTETPEPSEKKKSKGWSHPEVD